MTFIHGGMLSLRATKQPSGKGAWTWKGVEPSAQERFKSTTKVLPQYAPRKTAIQNPKSISDSVSLLRNIDVNGEA